MQKIKVRYRMGAWFVAIPGDVPDFSKHRHFTDALAKVQVELWRMKKELASQSRRLYSV